MQQTSKLFSSVSIIDFEQVNVNWDTSVLKIFQKYF